MKKLSVIVIMILLGSLYKTYSQPYRWIVPGTMSHRLDGSLDPAIDNDFLYRGHYYGYDVGGGMTNWGNSSFYEEFSLFEHVRDPDYITQPSDVDVVEPKDFKRHLLNFRMAYPAVFDSANVGPDEKYPLIIMMHGAGERADCWRGNCWSVTDPRRYWNNDHNISHGGRAHRDAINTDPTDPRHWPGFVVMPQNKNGWNPGSYVPRAITLVEELMKYYPIDPDRIYIHGLSNGADGAWMMMNERPDLFAAIAAMSGFANNGAQNFDVLDIDTTAVTQGIWQFQGGRDGNPRQSSTEQRMQQLRNAGALPRYTLYPNLGHGTWSTAYNEPDFFSWFLQYSQLTIHSFYGVEEICDGDEVAVKLGIAHGFDDYEWEKTNDAGVVSNVDGLVDRPNHIIADETGSYRVRFARGTEWSEWSEPFELRRRPRPSSEITANASVALPGLDNRVDVTLTTADQNGLYYEWFKNDVLFLEDSSQFALAVTEPGEYQLVVTDQGLCKSFPSNSQYISTLPYIGALPEAPTDLLAIGTTPGSISLFWTDNAQNEIGYDIYRSETDGDFQWVGRTDSDAISYVDINLSGDTEYFYRIRSYNEDGASDATGTVSATTLPDNENPTAPGNFTVEGFNYTETRLNVREDNYADEHFLIHLDQLKLSWSPATDNVTVGEYEIYTSDGTLIGTTSDTTYTATDLALDATMSFYVVAKDLSDNSSTPSNQDTFTTTFNGLKFNLYSGGTWDFVEEFSDWGIFAKGEYDNFSIDAAEGFVPDFDSDPNYFAFDFFGYVYIETAGEYLFETRTDDGSELWIGGDRIVSNDGVHGNVTRASDPMFLSVGPHPITVKYFERTGGESLRIRYAGPDTNNNRRVIPDEALRSSANVAPDAPVNPSGLTATADGTDFEIGLTWTHTDAANVGFEIYRKESSDTDYSIIHTTENGLLAYTDSGLKANQSYDYVIKAINGNGSSDFSDAATDTTAPDVDAPSIPTALTLQSVSESSVALSWTGSTDNVGVVEYIVYEGGAPTGTSSGRTQSRKSSSFTRSSTPVSGLSVVIEGLDAGTEYSFTVAAADAAGNVSAESNPPVVVTTSSSGPLPLDFVAFDAIVENNRVILEWTTVSEVNNERFEIERAFDPTQFEKIGALDGSGTTTEIKQYSFQDFNPLSVSYYRIKQIDFDGEFSYSRVIRVVYNEDALQSLTVFPNPTTSNNINMKGFVPTQNSAVQVQLMDVLGKVHFNTTMDPNLILDGVEIVPNQLLHPGIYLISINDQAGQNVVKRVVIN